jgi:hypothetical protein
MKKGLLIGVGLVVVIGVITALWAIGVSNAEVRLANRGNAQQEACDAYFDKMWKVLKEQAGVTEQYREAFAEIYPQLMEGRYSQGGNLMKWIQESNPDFDVSLYSKLMASIEGERNGFFVEQQKLIDIDREHKDMRETFPKKLVVGNRQNIGYEEDVDGTVIHAGIVIIKSTRTEQAKLTGKDDETLF